MREINYRYCKWICRNEEINLKNYMTREETLQYISTQKVTKNKCCWTGNSKNIAALQM